MKAKNEGELDNVMCFGKMTLSNWDNIIRRINEDRKKKGIMEYEREVYDIKKMNGSFMSM